MMRDRKMRFDVAACIATAIEADMTANVRTAQLTKAQGNE
jgi:hypothetical protein